MGTDFARMMRAMDETNVTEFVRFVAKERAENPEIDALPLKLGWPILLGGFTEKAANDARGREEDAA